MNTTQRSGSAIGWVLVVLVLIAILFAVGWLRLNRNNGNPSVEVDTTEIRSDSQQVIDEGREMIGKGTGEVREIEVSE